MSALITRTDSTDKFYVGEAFTLTFKFFNSSGTQVDPSTVVVTMRKPDGSTEELDVTESSNDRTVTIIPDAPGRYELDPYSATLKDRILSHFKVEPSFNDAAY